MIDADFKRLLDVLQLLLAWPTLAFIAFVAFVLTFKGELRLFLSNGRLKAPWVEPIQPVPSQPPPLSDTTEESSTPADEDEEGEQDR